MQSDSQTWLLNRYLIQNQDAVSFVTGRTPAGEQAILGVPGPYVAGLFFDVKGDFLRCDSRQPPLGHAAPLNQSGKVRGALLTQLWGMLNEWKTELELIPGTIAVSKFSVPQFGVWIADFPQYLQEYFDKRDSESDQVVRAELDNEVAEWQRSRKFVLQWGNEYWMNRNGEVTDT